MTKLGDIATEITAPAYDDKFYIWDTSAAAGSRDAFIELENIIKATDNELGFFNDLDDGSNQFRYRDRVFIGDACDADGNRATATNTWLGDLGDGIYTCSWVEREARLISMTDRGIGVCGVAKRAELSSTNVTYDGESTIAIGTMGWAYNNLDTAHAAWGGYFEGVRDADCGNTFGVEIDITNLAATPRTSALNPHSEWVTGSAIGLHLMSGGDADVWANTENADAALTIGNNGAAFNVGIVFLNGGLDTSGGGASAVLLADNNRIEWYEATDETRTAYITSQVYNNEHPQSLVFSPTGLLYRNGDGETIFRVQDNQDTVANYVDITATAAEGAPAVRAVGTDTNIDLQLVPKGSGYVRFGTRTASADAAITGYLPIRDSDGTVRKLAIIA